MQAVVLDEAGQPALGEVPEPDGSGVVVDIVACGLCGTDVQKLGRAAAGTVLGHEVVAKGGKTDDKSPSSTICPAARATAAGPGTETTCARFPEPTILPGGFTERASAARRSRSRTRSTSF